MAEQLEKDMEASKLYLNVKNYAVDFYSHCNDPVETVVMQEKR